MKRLIACLFASMCTGFSLSAGNLLRESDRTVDLVTTPEKAGKMNMKFILCGIPKGTCALKFSCDVKVDGVERGKEKWFDARIMSNYTDNKGKKQAGGPTLGNWKGTKDWRRYEKTFNVKVASDCLALMPCLFNVKAGELHIKNMSLEPVDGTGEKPKTPEELAAEQAKKAAARRQEIAEIDASVCVKCGRCTGVCKTGCLDGKAGTLDNERCVRCFNCVSACPKDAIKWKGAWKGEVDRGRRTALVNLVSLGAVYGLGSVFFRRARDCAKRELPPPGAKVSELRLKCTACGLCARRCPYQAITLDEEKRPVVDAEKCVGCGACEHYCPVGAISVTTLITDGMVRNML